MNKSNMQLVDLPDNVYEYFLHYFHTQILLL